MIHRHGALSAIVAVLLASAVFPRCDARGETAPPAPELRVWTLTGLERALRDSPPGPRRSVVIHAARNEWESFQIALRSPTKIRIADIEPALLRGPSGAIIPVQNIRLYREHQLHITHPTYRNERFRPGWYPDALIPFRHPLAGERLKGPRFRAVPFDLPPDETHAFWVDIHVPSDAMAGRYKGTFKVRLADKRIIAVPVELEVWDFALPRRSSLYTQFGSPAERMRRYYNNLLKKGVIKKLPDFEPIRAQCARLLTDHRLNCPLPPDLTSHEIREDGSFVLTDEQIDGIRRWAVSYHVNAVPVPSPHRYFKDPERERDRIHRWLRSWDRVLEAAGLSDCLAYTYLRDEPNDPKAYEFVRRWGKVIREANSCVKVLVTEQTKPQKAEWGDLYGAVDVWVPLFSLFDPESARRRQALGEQIWTYTALCQGKPTPWWHTDFPLYHYRVPAWIAWRYEMKGLLYWGGLSFWYHVEDPWTDPATYQPGDRSLPLSKRRIFNGEGSLTYPARDVGFDGAVPSMRLKVLRDAIEDYDCLALLERNGLRGKALEIVMPVARSWYEWARDPYEYLRARRRLAALILKSAR